MKDSVAKGIQNTKQAGQLRKDAAVHSRKSDLGKRSSSSGGGLQPSNSSNSLSSTSSTSTTRSSSGISNAGARNASRRMQNKQTVDKAINVAKKIPVARKYAKMAEKIQKIKNSRAAGFFGSMMNKVGKNSDVSGDDIEEAARADQNGEEYKPDDAEARYTAITGRQMRNLVIFILAGIVGGAVFFCVIMVSSMTNAAGVAYLASKSNPTEEELTEWYNNQSGSDESNSSSNNSNDSSSGSSTATSSSTAPVPVSKTGNQTIDKLNSIAVKEAEQATGRSKYENWYGFSSDWCAMFVSWLFDQINGLDKYFVRSAQAGPGARSSIAAGYGTWIEDECTDSKAVPKPGDVMHSRPLSPDDPNYVDKYSSGHVGYVYAVDNDNIYTVEGNSSDSEKVVFVTHSRKDCNINGYYRPKY